MPATMEPRGTTAEALQENLERTLKFSGDFEVEGSGHQKKIGGRGDRQRHEDVRAALEQQRRAGLSPAVVFNLLPMRLLVNTGQTGYFVIPGAGEELTSCDVGLEKLDPDGKFGFAKKYEGRIGIKILYGSGIDYSFDAKDMGGGNYAMGAIPPLLMGENAIRQYPDCGIFVVEFQKGIPDRKTGEVSYHAPLAYIEAMFEEKSKELEGFMWTYYRRAESAWAQSNHDGAVIQPPWIAAADLLFRRGLIPELPDWASNARSNIDKFTACYACASRIAVGAAVCSSCAKVQPQDDVEREQFAKLIRMGVNEPASLKPSTRAKRIADFESDAAEVA